ncbi:hypothetical protein D0T49_12850 [Paludibacter sp. 221]|uniref:hypothetical protein n=1 Tax=Paludibacter sp. 221 TaxID=2302939 RepID=UPI0013D190D3|nr:hypothetical protein [Paludibacter sp. 221]NDV47933.1 hypothetical protein [Paludibacter sp. 221]
MKHVILDYLTDEDKEYVNKTGVSFFNRHKPCRLSAETKDSFLHILQGLNTNENDMCLTILSHGYVSQDFKISGVVKDDQRINLILWREILDICNQIRTNNLLILNVLHPCNSCHIMDSYNGEDKVDRIWCSQTENATVNHALRAAMDFGDLSSFIADVSQDDEVDYLEY